MIGKVFSSMTHREGSDDTAVAAPTLNGQLNLESQRSLLLSNNAPWWVVLGDEVDKVLGIASRERLLTALLESRGGLTPVDLSEPVEYVPEMIRADRLLTDSVETVVGGRRRIRRFCRCDRLRIGFGRARGLVAKSDLSPTGLARASCIRQQRLLVRTRSNPQQLSDLQDVFIKLSPI